MRVNIKNTEPCWVEYGLVVAVPDRLAASLPRPSSAATEDGSSLHAVARQAFDNARPPALNLERIAGHLNQ